MKNHFIKQIAFWLVLVLLALALPSGTATYAGAVAQISIQAQPIFEELLPASSSTLSSASALKDYAGNAFDAWVRLVGNDTRVIIQKRDTTGRVVAQTEVIGSGGRKIRDAALFLDRDDIEVRLTDYELTPTQRINAYERAVWPNVAVPYPNGLDPRSGAGEAIYAQSQQVESGPTKEEIAAEVVRQLRIEIGGDANTTIRQAIEDKVKDGIGEGYDPARYASDARARYIQDAAAPWIRNRAYEGATSALNNYGACRAP